MTMSLPPKSLVLYADDDCDDIELIKDAFKEYAGIIELRTFPDAVELLQYVEHLSAFQPKPCLVIIDINMPRLTGKEALKELRKIEGFEEVPVVLFSTSSMPTDAAFAKHHHAGFVTKPLNARQIAHVVDQLMEHCTDELKKRISNQRGKQ